MFIKSIHLLPLRQKMTALNIVGGAVALLVTLALFSLIYFYSAQQRLSATATATARLLARNLTPMLVFGDRAAANTLLSALDQHPDALMAAVYHQHGEVFVTWTHPYRTHSHHPRPVALERLGADFVRFQAHELEVMVPMLQEDEQVGVFVLVESTHSITQEIENFIQVGLALALIILGLMALLLHQLQLRALAPVFELANLAKQVASRYDYRLRAYCNR